MPEPIHNVLKMTHLVKLFDTYDCEGRKRSQRSITLSGSWEKLKTTGPSILCIDSSADVLAYLQELLRRAGYVAYTSNNLHGFLDPDADHASGIVVAGTESERRSGERKKPFRAACEKLRP